MISLPLLVSALFGLASAQHPGKSPEVHPKLQAWKCTTHGGCVPRNGAVVLDDLAHPVHQLTDTSLGCGNWGSGPNATVCPDEKTCSKNCIVEGISDYSAYGITTNGSALHMTMFNAAGADVSPRAYLLEDNGHYYEHLKLTGKELSFDVDMSKLPCGMNAALYLTEMSQSGGRSSLNPGGATYGTGYCDGQCYTYPFVNGVGNIEGKGACCNEMDIWEANGYATAMTPHTCNITGLYECTGAECTWDGVCDQWGCGWSPYGEGQKDYYGPGPGYTVDTLKPMTVVTQFPTFKNGSLQAINRLYVQNGKVIYSLPVNITGTPAYTEINADFCAPSASRFVPLGGLQEMGEALGRGMTLIFALWWDTSGYMNWLDSGNAGPCNATEGNPTVITTVEPNPSVTWSNIKWGDIGSTYMSS